MMHQHLLLARQLDYSQILVFQNSEKISFEFNLPPSPRKTFVTMETYSEELRATWLSIVMTSLRTVIGLSADTSEARKDSP